MVGQQRSARRRHEGRQAPQQLQGIEEQRRGAVTPAPAELIPELPPPVLSVSRSTARGGRSVQARPELDP